jgi:hypothetical protein
MSRYRSFVFLLSLFLIATVNPLAAQDQQQQESENSLLPEIDPQDIEIRSQFQARFPGLRRQPILGFEPTPRVYQIDPSRMPFMETQEEVVANLPVSELSRPDPPAYTPLHYSSDINASGRAGIGSYISPEVKFWGVTRLNSKSYIGGDLDYSSSDGHLDRPSSFRFFSANGEFATKLNPRSRLAFDGGFENSFNHMIELGPGAAIPETAKKEYDGFNLNGEFQSFKNSITGWKVQANLRYFNANLTDAGNSSGDSEEMVYNGSVAKRWAGSNVNETFTIKLGAKAGNFSSDRFSNNWLTAQGGVEYERLFDYSTKVTADASLYYGSDAFDSKVYIGPSLHIEQPFVDIITLKARVEARPYVKTIEQLHSRNRFLNVNDNLRHSYNLKGLAEASIEYANFGTLNFGVQYENITDYPVFVRQTMTIVGGTSLGYYEADYTDVRRARAYASVSHQIIPERFWLNGKVYVQSPQIQDGGRIPYEEKLGINSSLSIRPVDMLTFEGWVDYTGPRRTLRTDEELNGFLLLGGQLDVEITDRFGAYIKLVNLLSQEYEIWQGYTERPFQAYGGVTVKL